MADILRFQSYALCNHQSDILSCWHFCFRYTIFRQNIKIFVTYCFFRMVIGTNWYGRILPNFLEQVKKREHYWVSVLNMDNNDWRYFKLRLISVPILTTNWSSNSSTFLICQNLLSDDDEMLTRWLLLWYGCLKFLNKTMYYLLVHWIFSILLARNLLIWSHSTIIWCKKKSFVPILWTC